MMSYRKTWRRLGVTALVLLLALSSALSALASEQPMKLAALHQLASDQSVNIMIYDSKGRIVQEYHADGGEVSFKYRDGRMVQSRDGRGLEYRYQQVQDRVEVTVVSDGKEVGKRVLARRPPGLQRYTRDEKQSMTEQKINGARKQQESNAFTTSSTTYEDYFVDGVRMNDIAVSRPNHWPDRFTRQSTNLTQQQIQAFFENENSILKEQVQIWRMDSYGNVYNTDQTILPSEAIAAAALEHNMNPKVIIASLQKEASLVTAPPGSVSFSQRQFYYAMGYGATDDGDLSGTSGFDIQINKGTELLWQGWLSAPLSMPAKFSPTTDRRQHPVALPIRTTSGLITGELGPSITTHLTH